MSRLTVREGSANPSTAECQEALAHVLQSHTFARAEKLQRFLKFVSGMTLGGEGTLVNEHLIAIDVFGRGDDYSPGEDSVVRRQAHALRRKLKEYYEQEGQTDPVHIEIPVGTYVPVFRDKRAESASHPDTRSPAPPEWHPAWRPTLQGALVLLIAAVLVYIGWALGRVGRAPAAPAAMESALRELWGPWLGDKSGAVLCFSNPPVATVRRLPGPIRPNPEHSGIAVTKDQDAEFRRFFHLPGDGVLYLYPVMAQAKMGEAMAAVTLAGFFTRAGTPVSAAESRFVTWPTLRRENIILLGHADSDQWVEPVLRSAPFQLAPTDQEHRARILNTHPQNGEPAEYHPNIPIASRSYALVAMLPGMDGAHRIMVVGGLDTGSTATAADFLASKEGAEALLRKLRAAAPGHTGPWSFEAVLETDVRDAVALKAVPVAVRVL